MLFFYFRAHQNRENKVASKNREISLSHDDEYPPFLGGI
jgi:hypothetical protein